MKTNDAKKFDSLLDEYFKQTLAARPVWGNHLGIRAAEGKLEEPTLKALRADEKRRQKLLTELDRLAPSALSAEQHLDRLAVRAMLLAECEDFDRGIHRLDPDAVDHLFGALLHELQRGEDEPARARRNVRALLEQAPKYLRQAARLVDRPERVWRKVMDQTVAGAGPLFEAVRSFMGANAERLIATSQKAVAHYHTEVMARPLAAKNSFALGATRLQRRVRDELGLDYTLGQVESLALSEADRVGGLLAKVCAKYGRGRSADAIIEKARSEWNPGGGLLDVYRAETDRVASGFRKAKAVGFPVGDELQVRLVPEFMRHLYPTAAYSSPGPFEKRQRGIFWVNDLSLAKSSAAEKLSEVQQHFGISRCCWLSVLRCPPNAKDNNARNGQENPEQPTYIRWPAFEWPVKKETVQRPNTAQRHGQPKGNLKQGIVGQCWAEKRHEGYPRQYLQPTHPGQCRQFVPQRRRWFDGSSDRDCCTSMKGWLIGWTCANPDQRAAGTFGRPCRRGGMNPWGDSL